MARLLVPLSSMEVFADAGRAQSFREAAERLSLTPSAVSQSIRKLEQKLSCSLFERTGNSVRLNEAGVRLLREIETGIEHMRRGIESIVMNADAPLSINSPPGFADILMPVIRDLMALNTLDVSLVADETPDYISFRKHDVAIVYGASAPPAADLENLGIDVFTPVCRPDVAAMLTNAASLVDMPLLVNETATVTWDDWLSLNDVRKRPKRRLRFNRLAPIMSSLLDGVGVALESLRFTSPYIERGELVQCLPFTTSIRRDLTYLYVTPDPTKRAASDIVARLIRAYCSTNDKETCGQRYCCPAYPRLLQHK